MVRYNTDMSNLRSPVASAFIVLGAVFLMTYSRWDGLGQDGEGSEREVKLFPSRTVAGVSLTLFLVSSMFLLVTALWQHAVASTLVTSLEASSYGAIKAHVGVIGIIFGWAVCGLVYVVAWGLLVLILSIRVLEELTD